jgi:hypothetical protein
MDDSIFPICNSGLSLNICVRLDYRPEWSSVERTALRPGREFMAMNIRRRGLSAWMTTRIVRSSSRVRQIGNKRDGLAKLINAQPMLDHRHKICEVLGHHENWSPTGIEFLIYT